MASVSGNMKGFYRQQKKNTTNTKSSKKPQQQQHKSASFDSGIPQPPALIASGGNLDLQDGHNEIESILRQFDMNMAYGPCIGITRLARWERAHKLGLNPPQEIEALLRRDKVQKESLWDGLI